MENLLTMAFEANSSERNHHRRYQISIGRDLFGDWTISICYGRIGQTGRAMLFADRDAATMRAVIDERLRRRLSAPKRIGCSYRLTHVDVADGFEGDDWLPEKVFAQLSLETQVS